MKDNYHHSSNLFNVPDGERVSCDGCPFLIIKGNGKFRCKDNYRKLQKRKGKWWQLAGIHLGSDKKWYRIYNCRKKEKGL